MLAVNVAELSLCITVIYKQQSVNNEVFLQHFIEFLNNKKNVIIVGDTNIDFLKDTLSMRRYLDALLSNGYFVLNKIDHNFATRVATKKMQNGNSISTSRTIIDHVISNCMNYSFSLSLCDTSLSDHKQMLLCSDNNKSNNFMVFNKTDSFQRLDYNSYNREIEHLLLNTNIMSIDQLVNSFEIIKNKHLRNHSSSVKYNPCKPWLNNEFFSLLNEKSRYFRLKKISY